MTDRERQEEMEERIEIPQVVYSGDDKKLQERVSKFKAGTFRIIVFTLVGFFMGACSHTYVRDSFLPTKLIMAVPYKICEIIYVFLIGTDAGELYRRGISVGFITEFFPHSQVAILLAEYVTTVLIGGAVYGALAYFTGDRRVFTLRRFLKFAGVWCAVILTMVGITYGVNAKAIWDNEHFRGEPRFFLISSSGRGSGMDRDGLKEAFYSDLEPFETERDYGKELELTIYYGELELRAGYYRVNYEAGYIVTEQGKMYHISDEFAQAVREFEEGSTGWEAERAEAVE